MTNLNCYKNLAAAIVLQAYKDYVFCAKRVKRNSRDKELCLKEMRSIVKFAKSEWYTQLTSIPQAVFLRKLKEVYDLD